VSEDGENVVIMPAWLDYKQAEAYANLSRTTLWILINERKIKAARIGRAVRIEHEYRSILLAVTIPTTASTDTLAAIAPAEAAAILAAPSAAVTVSPYVRGAAAASEATSARECRECGSQ